MVSFYKKYGCKPCSILLMVAVWLASCLTILSLSFLLVYVLAQGLPYIDTNILDIKYTTQNLSLIPALVNTILMVVLALGLATPLGIFAAIYLVEYAKDKNRVVNVVGVTADTLAGIPSIIYGLFGMLFFVSFLKMGFSLLAGSCTVGIMILPLIIRTTEEALRSVPISYREGSYGLGAGKLRTIFVVVLPAAVPGILAGIILSIGRIVGESAALLYTAGTVAALPENIFSSVRTLAVHMYVLASEGLHMEQAAATAVVLLVIVLFINQAAIRLAGKLMKGNQNG